MKNLILMAFDKANQLSDEELAKEIAELESGKRKLRLPDERGRLVPLNDIIVAVYRRVQLDRKKCA